MVKEEHVVGGLVVGCIRQIRGFGKRTFEGRVVAVGKNDHIFLA